MDFLFHKLFHSGAQVVDGLLIIVRYSVHDAVADVILQNHFTFQIQ